MNNVESCFSRASSCVVELGSDVVYDEFVRVAQLIDLLYKCLTFSIVVMKMVLYGIFIIYAVVMSEYCMNR